MNTLQSKDIDHAVAKSAPTATEAVSGNPGSSHVRFTASEYSHIQNDSEITGTSIPNLLKHAYFVGGPIVPLMRKDDLKMLMSQLARIGNNVNQIARQVNSGFREGFNDDLSESRRALTQLVQFITSTYGHSKFQRGAD